MLAFRRRRYLWIALLLGGLSIVAYWLDDPQEPANGGTVLGYTLGTAGAILILWLAWFGIRKRRYASTLGTVQGWLSAHVYFGVLLLLVVLLHTGFQFGFNVHTLAFALMVFVIVSGLFGVFVYVKYPERISLNRGGASQSDLLDQLQDLDERCRRTAKQLPVEFQELVSSGISRLQLGGSMWARLRARDESQVLVQRDGKSTVVANPGQEAALDWLAEQQSRCADPAVAAVIGELSALLRNKRRLLKPLAEDMRLQALLQVWLCVHIPMTAASLVALLVHIVTVFIYW
jgi:hypothetical protein